MSSKAALEARYPDAIKCKQALEQSLKFLKSSSITTSVGRKQHILGQIKQLDGSVVGLNEILKECDTGRQDFAVWNARLRRLATDSKLLINDCNRALERDEKAFLLSGEDIAPLPRGLDSRREANLLDESLNMINEALAAGKESASRLANQNKILKNAGRHVRRALATMGVSHAVLNTIDRRVGIDRVIVYGGMLITSTLIYCFYCWWSRISPIWFIPSFILAATKKTPMPY